MSTYLVKHVSASGQTYYRTVYYRAPTVLQREGKHLVFSFEYHAEVVERLKAVIPRGWRRYRPGAQVWLVHPNYGEAIILLVKQILDEEITITEEEHVGAQG